MKVIKEVRNIEILINIIYDIENDLLVQKFNFVCSNKKHYSYLFDKRFHFKKIIENIISDLKLQDFIKREDDEAEVRVYYKNQEKPKNIIRKVMCQIPPCCGCEFCDLAEEKELFLYCPEKNKHYTKPGIKRCPAFRMRRELIT